MRIEYLLNVQKKFKHIFLNLIYIDYVKKFKYMFFNLVYID